jgi:hypothetical protein
MLLTKAANFSPCVVVFQGKKYNNKKRNLKKIGSGKILFKFMGNWKGLSSMSPSIII